MDEIKHEVMVNYLYQQQCSHIWVGSNHQLEGSIVRKTRGEYQTCPPALADSPFAAAIQALNVQVKEIKNHSLPRIPRMTSQRLICCSAP